jgi:hypothetical protein
MKKLQISRYLPNNKVAITFEGEREVVFKIKRVDALLLLHIWNELVEKYQKPRANR